MAKYLYQILLISTLCLFLQNTSAQESTTGFENGNNQYVMRESNLSDMSKDKKSNLLHLELKQEHPSICRGMTFLLSI